MPTGQLTVALKALATQSGVEFVYSTDQLEGLQTNGVHGELTAEKALDRLLEGTNLKVTTHESGSLLISYLPPSEMKAVEGPETPNNIAPSKQEASGNKEQVAQEVVVTGTLLQPSGFTTPTPVTVIGEDVIAQRAPNDPGELLREIPSLKISSGAGMTGTGSRTSVGQSYVDFYGLTPFRTLVLVDGMRQAATSSASNVDINVIPTLMIERVETITGGASATYGADAVGGVANFILRSNIDGLKVNAAWGATDHGDKQTPSLNLGFGTAIGSRTNLVVGVDLTRDAGIESLYARDWGRKEPGLFAYGNAGAARGTQPARLFVNNYEQKTATPGGIITGCTPSPCPASLTNIAFDSNGNPYTFVPGTTTSTSTAMYGNTSNYGNNPSGQLSLSASYKRWTGMAKATIELTDDMQLKLTAGYSGTSGVERFDLVQSSGTNAATVTNTNPFLPASTRAAMNAAGVTTIRVGRSNFDLGYGYTGQVNHLVAGSAQLTGRIAGSWNYDVYYKASQLNSDGFTTGFRTADIAAAFSNCTVLVTGTGANAIPATPGCVGYDIFGQGKASQGALDYLNQYEQGFDVFIKQNIAQGLVRGVPFSTWAGEVNVGFGAQYRTDAVVRTPTLDSAAFAVGGFSSGFVFGNFSEFAADRSVKEYFGEANVPLVKDVPFVQALSANLGYRYLDYSDNGGWNTWKAGLTWDLNDEIRVRVVRSRDIRSPTLFGQYANGTQMLAQGITDPRTGQLVNNGAALPFVVSTNPTLRPEVAATTTAGFVLQPLWASGLQVSLDYFRIKIDDAIVNPSAQQIVNRCLRDGDTTLCQYITFDSAGVVTFVYRPPANYNEVDVAGYNAEIAYKIPGQFLGGEWDVRGLATYMDKFETTDNFAGVIYDDIGTNNSGQPRLQSNLLLTYNHGSFSTTASWRYLRGFKYSSSENGIWVGPDDPLYFSTVSSTTAMPCPGGAATCPWYQTAANSISQNKFPAASYLNWSAQYIVGSSRWREMQIYVKIDNVLDKDPPDYAVAAFPTSNVYDVFGRYFKVGFRASF